MATDKGKQFLSATIRKGHRCEITKVILAHTGSIDTSVIVSWLRETYGCEVVLVTDAVGHVSSGKGDSLEDPNEPDKKAMHSVFFEPEGVPNEPQFLAGMPASIEGTFFPSASLLSELNMVENQLKYDYIQFEVPYAGVSFDPFRQLASPGGIAGFCELGYPESAYGGMLFDPFWESIFSYSKGKTIQFDAKSAYAGMRFDQFQKSAPLSVTFLAAGSCEPFDPFRLSASVGTAGFCELVYAESAYGGMLFDPFWESDLILKGKSIQFHANSAYAGMWFDQFRMSAPPSITFLAACSCELLTIQFKGTLDFMYVGGWVV